MDKIEINEVEVKNQEYCDNCGDTIYKAIEEFGKVRKVKIMCSCKNEEYEKKKQLKEKEQKQNRIQQMRSWSIMDSNFKECTIENYKVKNKYDKKHLKLIKRYINKWPELKENNKGLLLHGEVGVGKTHIASTITNELIKQLVPAIAINVNGFLGKLKKNYNTFENTGDYEIINKLKNVSLLYIDDLGAERKSEWTSEKIYELIDARYRSKKPIIVTTNIPIRDLKDQMCNKDQVPRTFDRLMEMCMLFEVKGVNRRLNKFKENQEYFKKFMED